MCGRNGTRTVLKHRDRFRKCTGIFMSLRGPAGLWTCFLVWIVVCADDGPSATQPGLGNMSSSSVTLTVEFLSKYGYLPHSDLETSNLVKEDRLREAIRTMQKFGNIPQTGIIDTATLNLMKKKRCGVADLIGNSERMKRYALQGQKWAGTDLTWSVKEPLEKTDVSMVRNQLARAFAVWADASILTFKEVRGTKADIVVSFLHGSHGDGYPFDGEGSVLAHAFFPGEGIGGDAHFDAEERWLPEQLLQDDDGVYLFAVAAHEIGHSLGLSHSSTPGSLMFPYYQMVGSYFKLPDDDANGIQQLYGSKNATKWATMPDEYLTMPVRPTRRTTTIRRTTAKPTQFTRRSKGTQRATRITTTSTSAVHTNFNKKPTTTTTTTTNILPVITTKSTYDENSIPNPPDPCNTSVDAIAVIRREVFLFKNKYFWRLAANHTLKRGYPAPINRFWHDLPHDIKNVDAVYERPHDTKIVFFIGRQYWMFTANQLTVGYPRPITDLGLPSYVDKIDSAFVWGHNGKTYFFSGERYWKFDEIDGAVELDYPRNISAWRGVPRNVDAAFQGTDGNTYFFKEKQYWKFNDFKMRVHEPGDATKFWFGCGQRSKEKLFTSGLPEEPTILQISEHNGQKYRKPFRVVIFIIVISGHLLRRI